VPDGPIYRYRDSAMTGARDAIDEFTPRKSVAAKSEDSLRNRRSTESHD
jgi:hypothetical protein